MTPAPTLIFVRHGETDWNVEQRLQGQQDVPLNARGRDQARRHGLALAQAMSQIAGYDFVSSPLGRARETMEILRAALGLDPMAYRVDPALVEITFGAWEGFTLPELALTAADEVARRIADKWGYVPPGGESYAMLWQRIAAWQDRVQRDTVAVSHGAVLRIVSGRLYGTPDAEIPLLPAPQDKVLVAKGRDARWV